MKLIWVVVLVLIYRIGTIIPVPFVDASNFDATFGNTIFAYMNTLSGGALSTATLFALGVSPYITASIVIQLITVAFPKLGEKFKDGEQGKSLMETWTRVCTVLLAVVTGYGYYNLLASNGMLMDDITHPVLAGFVIVACYCAGASIVMFIGEKINEKGIGNGISIILFANIVAGLPSFVIRLVDLVVAAFKVGTGGVIAIAIIIAVFVVLIMLAVVVFVIFVTGSERRIPIQYAKRTVGRKMYGGQSTTLPIKLNMTGVMPIIFASSIVSLPATILTLTGVTTAAGQAAHPHWYAFYEFCAPNSWFYPLILFVLIIAFAYFYVTISFSPLEVANNLQKNGGTIMGVRPGKPTAQFISKILSKITLIGALFLAIIAIFPIAVSPLMEFAISKILVGYQAETISSIASSFMFGGTSILIVVGVVLETAREIEAQLTMRNVKGFL